MQRHLVNDHRMRRTFNAAFCTKVNTRLGQLQGHNRIVHIRLERPCRCNTHIRDWIRSARAVSHNETMFGINFAKAVLRALQGWHPHWNHPGTQAPGTAPAEETCALWRTHVSSNMVCPARLGPLFYGEAGQGFPAPVAGSCPNVARTFCLNNSMLHRPEK